jgi:hypothetical protein
MKIEIPFINEDTAFCMIFSVWMIFCEWYSMLDGLFVNLNGLLDQVKIHKKRGSINRKQT